jgi:hypothetical protein
METKMSGTLLAIKEEYPAVKKERCDIIYKDLTMDTLFLSEINIIILAEEMYKVDKKASVWRVKFGEERESRKVVFKKAE